MTRLFLYQHPKYLQFPRKNYPRNLLMLCSKYTLLHCIPVIPPKNFLEHEMIRVRETEFALFLISGFVLDKKVPGKCFKILQVLYIYVIYESYVNIYKWKNHFYWVFHWAQTLKLGGVDCYRGSIQRNLLFCRNGPNFLITSQRQEFHGYFMFQRTSEATTN